MEKKTENVKEGMEYNCWLHGRDMTITNGIRVNPWPECGTLYIWPHKEEKVSNIMCISSS